MHRVRAGLVLAVSILAGCSSPNTTAEPTGAAATPTPPAPSATTGAGQVDSEWGPIWDALPTAFPVHPGAQEAEPDAPASAAFTIPASPTVTVRAVATWYGEQLATVGPGGLDGPLEDGSYSAWSSSGGGCDIRVSAVPRGSEEVYVTVFLGALCPFDWPGG
jgi:hypothetical protein